MLCPRKFAADINLFFSLFVFLFGGRQNGYIRLRKLKFATNFIFLRIG